MEISISKHTAPESRGSIKIHYNGTRESSESRFHLRNQ
jgi:hypothetical protein